MWHKSEVLTRWPPWRHNGNTCVELRVSAERGLGNRGSVLGTGIDKYRKSIPKVPRLLVAGAPTALGGRLSSSWPSSASKSSKRSPKSRIPSASFESTLPKGFFFSSLVQQTWLQLWQLPAAGKRGGAKQALNGPMSSLEGQLSRATRGTLLTHLTGTHAHDTCPRLFR